MNPAPLATTLAAMSQDRAHKIISDIEALRAIAVLMVMVAHLPWFWAAPETAWLKTVLARWWSGVDVFFCISGFVISRSLLANMEAAGSGQRVVVPFLY